MLVLLIIFMVAAPLLTVGVQLICLKRAKPLEGDTEPITISVTSAGEIYSETPIALDEIVQLEAIAQTVTRNGSTCAEIKPDYGTIMRNMGRINAAGFKRLGLVTLEEGDS